MPMRRSCSASLSVALVILAVVLGTPCLTPALAHKVVVFATCTGKTIDGEVYFHGGAAARNVKVTLAGPDGQVVGETQTDEEGKFTFPVRFRCDHKVIADAGGGHGAEYIVPAEELPEGLPPPEGGDQPGGTRPEQAKPTAPAPTSPAPNSSPGQENLEAKTEAIAHQLAALRSDLNQYKNELRLRDVLGGLGYILGIMGVVFYFLGVRRKEKRSASTEAQGAS
jgi:nickel transport protein